MSKFSKISNIALRVAIIASFILSVVLFTKGMAAIADLFKDSTEGLKLITGSGFSENITQAEANDILKTFSNMLNNNISSIDLFAALSTVLVALAVIAEILSWLAIKATNVAASIGRSILLLINLGICSVVFFLNTAAQWAMNYTPSSAIENDYVSEFTTTITKAFTDSGLTVDANQAVVMSGTLCSVLGWILVFIAVIVLFVLTITSIVSLVKTLKANNEY